MRSPARGQSDETDDYITRLTGNAVTHTNYRVNAADPVAPSASQPLIQPSRVVAVRQTPKSVAARIVSSVLGVIIFAAGVVGLIVAVGSFHFMQYLLPLAFWPCIGAIVVCWIAGGCAFVLGCVRALPVTVTAVILSFALMGFGIGGIAITVMISEGHLINTSLADHWNASVSGHESSVCNFEQQFSCRGWATPCGSNNNSNASVPSSNHTDGNNTHPANSTTTTAASSTTTMAPFRVFAIDMHPDHHSDAPPTDVPRTDPQSEFPHPTNGPTTQPPNGTGNHTGGNNTSNTTDHNATLAPPSLPLDYACAQCGGTADADVPLCVDAFPEYVKSKLPLIICGLLGLVVVSVGTICATLIARRAVDVIESRGIF